MFLCKERHRHIKLVAKKSARGKSYVCTSCGYKSKWNLQSCPQCKQNDTFVDEVFENSNTVRNVANRKPEGTRIATPKTFSEVKMFEHERMSTGISEFDRVLGGGIVSGMIFVLGGSPGAGKSTLLLETASNISKKGGRVLYISGEESEQQLKIRAGRLGIGEESAMQVVYETNLNNIFDIHIPMSEPHLIIVDSINSIMSPETDSLPGSISQVNVCESRLQSYAKLTHTPIILVSQVTKDGQVAGSNKLSHNVDAVLYLEGDSSDLYRILRAQKNRFGNASEIGVFSMESTGLREVTNPSEMFLAERSLTSPGSAIGVTLEGNRPLVIEIQSLAVLTHNAVNPTNRYNGLDRDRASLVTAVINKHLPYAVVSRYDLHSSVVGGLKVRESAVDLPLAMSIVSSRFDVAVPADFITIGEIGLTGEIRKATRTDIRLKEAYKLGFSTAIVPKFYGRIEFPQGMKVIEMDTLHDVVKYVFGNRIDYGEMSYRPGLYDLPSADELELQAIAIEAT